MIVPLVIVGALAIMMVFWPQDAAYVVDVIITLCQDLADDIREGVEEAQDRAK